MPYFAPAKNTQFILMNPGESTLRIYEHYFSDEDGRETLKLVRIKKIQHKSFSGINVKCLHTAISTGGSEILALIDNTDMHLYDTSGIDLSENARQDIHFIKSYTVHEKVNY